MASCNGPTPGDVVTSVDTNNSFNVAIGSQELTDYLAAHPELAGLPSTAIFPTDGLFFNATIDTEVAVIASGSNVEVDVETQASVFVGGPSTVVFSGSQTVDVVIGSGDSNVTANVGGSKLQSTTGDDTLIAGNGSGLAAGPTSALAAPTGVTTLSGGFGSDSMVGGGNTFLSGGSTGGDTMKGGNSQGAHDTLYAGIGGDLLVTKAGNNVIYGNENDTIKAGRGQDTVVAGYSAETVSGGHSGVIFGGGQTLMTGGNENNYYMTGSDTMLGSSHDNTVTTTEGSSVLVNGGEKGSTGHIDVNLVSSGDANDTMFGGSGGLTIHVQQDFQGTVDQGLDASGAHVLQLSSGQTLHVSNVTIDFNGDKHNV